MSRNDYRVSLKVRNNNIIEAIENMGEAPGQKWCAKHGFGYHHLIRLVNMTLSPIDDDGRLKPFAEKLCEITYSTPEDLWCEEQLTPLQTNRAEIKMKPNEVRALMWADKRGIESPESATERHLIASTVSDVLDTLKPRERDILLRRFGFYGEDETLTEIADTHGVQKERIRQIEAHALRKLRHPSRAKELRKCDEAARGFDSE